MRMSFRQPAIPEKEKPKEKPTRYSSIDQVDVDTIESLQAQVALYRNRYRDVTSQNKELRSHLEVVRSILLPIIDKEKEYRPETSTLILEEAEFDRDDPTNGVQCAEVLRKLIYYQAPLMEKMEDTLLRKDEEWKGFLSGKEQEVERLQKELAYQQEKIDELVTLSNAQKAELDERKNEPIPVRSTGMKIIIKPAQEKIEEEPEEKREETVVMEPEPDPEPVPELEPEPEPARVIPVNNPFDIEEDPFDIKIEGEDETMREIAEPTYLTLLKDKGVKLLDTDNPKFDKQIVHQGEEAPLRYIDFVIDSIHFFDDLMENTDNICLVFSDADCYRKGHSQFTKWIIRSPRRRDIKFSLTSIEKLEAKGLGSFNHL